VAGDYKVIYRLVLSNRQIWCETYNNRISSEYEVKTQFKKKNINQHK